MGRSILAGFGAGAAFAAMVLVVVAAVLPPPPPRAPTPRIVSSAPAVELAVREAATGRERPAVESPRQDVGPGGDTTVAAPTGRQQVAGETGPRPAAPVTEPPVAEPSMTEPPVTESALAESALAERTAEESPRAEGPASRGGQQTTAALPPAGAGPARPDREPAPSAEAVTLPSAPAGAATLALPSQSGSPAPEVAADAAARRSVARGRETAKRDVAAPGAPAARAPSRAPSREPSRVARVASEETGPVVRPVAGAVAGGARPDPAPSFRPDTAARAGAGSVPDRATQIAALDARRSAAGPATRAETSAPGRAPALAPGQQATARPEGGSVRPDRATLPAPRPSSDASARRMAASAPAGGAGAVPPRAAGTSAATPAGIAPGPEAGVAGSGPAATGAETRRAGSAADREGRVAARPPADAPGALDARAEAATAPRARVGEARAAEVEEDIAALRRAPVQPAVGRGGHGAAPATRAESPRRPATGRETVREAPRAVAAVDVRDAAAHRAPMRAGPVKGGPVRAGPVLAGLALEGRARAGAARPSRDAPAGAAPQARVRPATVRRRGPPPHSATSGGVAVPARAELSPPPGSISASRAPARTPGPAEPPRVRPPGAELPLPPGYEARPPEQPERPRVAQSEPGAGGLGTPVAPLTERVPDRAGAGVRILRPPSDPGEGAGPAEGGARRLPGSGPVAPIVNAEAPPDPAADAPQDRAPALVRNAAAFDGAADGPLLAVVLRHTGAVPPERVAALGLPLTIAVDPGLAGAAEIAASYRAAGLEVVLLGLGLPEGATPRDAEVTLGARFSQFPGVIGVLDRRAGGFADDLALTAQIAGILEADGYGLLLWDAGLNSALGVAERAGATAALIWRQVDDDGMSAPAVGRRLGRAAFEAARDAAVIVMAQTRPETLEALAAFAGPAERATLAPVSAVLTRE